MMWWAVWCAAVVAAGAGAAAAPAPDGLAPLPPLDFVQVDPPGPDDESMGYAMLPMNGARYYGSAGAPWLYYLAEPHDTQVSKKVDEFTLRERRDFSVNPAVELLQRGAYNNYMAHVAQHNREFLDCVGKRDSTGTADCQFKN